MADSLDYSAHALTLTKCRFIIAEHIFVTVGEAKKVGRNALPELFCQLQPALIESPGSFIPFQEFKTWRVALICTE
jgi:hypothetical protein